MGLPTNVSASTAGSCSQLFLSEYCQDTLLNNAIEIYNPTASAISLNGYYLTVASGTNTASQIPLTTTDSIQPHKTWVVVNSKAPSAALRAKANQLTGLTYKATDVVGLVFGNIAAVTMIDVIGDPNGTPTANGWVVTALGDTAYTKNHDLTRLMNISGGDINWSKAQHEWFAHPMDTYGFLGWHNGVCNPASLPTAIFGSSTYAANITGSTNTAFPVSGITINLTGTWSQAIWIYYDDTYTWNGASSNTGAPNLPYNCNGGTNNITNSAYYSYSIGSNFVMFNANATNGTVILPITNITIEAGNLNNYICTNHLSTSQYLCFGVDKDPSGAQYVLGNQDVTTIDIQGGCIVAGIKQLFDNKQIEVYPNPLNDKVTIQNKSQESITKIIICDMLGREIMTLNPNQTNNPIVINTQGIDNGVYFVKVYNNSDGFTVKLIKE